MAQLIPKNDLWNQLPLEVCTSLKEKYHHARYFK